MTGDNTFEVKVYDLICRHFLASISKDAVAQETHVIASMGEEQFETSGLIVDKKNYLKIYPFDNWETNLLPDYKKGDILKYESLKVSKATSKPPSYL